MNHVITYLFILTVSFVGADRINLLSSSFEFFNFTPFILFSLMFVLSVLVLKIHSLNFSWLYYDKASLVFLNIFLICTLVSILFSQDYLYSTKRILLLILILLTFILSISHFSSDKLNKILVNASVLGSLFFFIFNLSMVYLWINFLEYENLFIDLIPNKIAYFIPRLGGYSLDVNRGGVVLMFYTFCLLFNNKTRLIKFVLFINIITLLFTFSRTVYLLIFFTLLYYLLYELDRKRVYKLFKYLFFAIIISISLLFYLDSIKLIELDYLLEERLNIDWELSRHTSSGIHLRLIVEGIQTVFNNLKILILGNGFGTSFLLIEGYYWSGTKYANYHSMYITLLVECGIFAFLAAVFYTFIIPLFNKTKNLYMPVIFGLFFYNIFYQLILEPVYWFIVLLYYYENYKVSNNEA